MRLEQSAELERGAKYGKCLPGMYEEMRVSDADNTLLDVIAERGEPATPEECAALERLGAEWERDYEVVSAHLAQQRHQNRLR